MSDPLAMLANDRAKASAAGDPWASLCVLATVSENHLPQARVLVLRDLDDGLGLFINRTSPKQREIDASGRVALLVYLASLGVQYRVEANLATLEPELVRSSWRLRPDIPKVMDWLYETRVPQSSVLENRDDLLDLYSAVKGELSTDADAPDSAAGYRIIATRIERLQLAADRVHERDLYETDAQGWRHRVLVP